MTEIVTARGQSFATVADLLATAKQAHTEYRQLAQRRPTRGNRKGLPPMLQPIRAALTALAAAERRDPDHTDPAWDEMPQYEQLVEFYTSYLSRTS